MFLIALTRLRTHLLLTPQYTTVNDTDGGAAAATPDPDFTNFHEDTAFYDYADDTADANMLDKDDNNNDHMTDIATVPGQYTHLPYRL